MLIKRTLPLVAHPKGIKACPKKVKQSVILVIGPEGGFIQYEIDTFSSIGFSVINIGERILKTETAVPALISKLF